MANNIETALDGAIVAQAAAELIALDLPLSATTYRDAEAAFGYGSGSIVRVRVPGATPTFTRGAYATTELETGDLSEGAIPVTLETDAYSSVLLPHAEMSLDIQSFGGQVLAPQARSVASYIERTTAAAMQATPVDTAITYDAAKPRATVIAMRAALRANGVEAGEPLVGVAGTNVFADLLTADPTLNTDGPVSVAGVVIQESALVDADALIVYIPAAFATVMRAPQTTAAPWSGSAVARATDTPMPLGTVRDLSSPTAAASVSAAYDVSHGAVRSTLSVLVGSSAMPLPVYAADGTLSLLEHGGVAHVNASA
jgi:hypothetical protein